MAVSSAEAPDNLRRFGFQPERPAGSEWRAGGGDLHVQL